MAQSTSGTTTNSSSVDYYPQDPILQFRPPFAQSLPVQLLLSGITLTLAFVLLLHLLFTAQYHFPLARANYVLQLAGVTTLLISIISTIAVIFTTTIQQSQHWPYMLSYLAVEMPSANYSLNSTDPTLAYLHRWSQSESATWVVMNATTSVVVQITHIHFLTLLYPSNLEARLIFGLLGPLAVISAVMQLLPVIWGVTVASIAEDTRNVCNAALSLLFTSFLIIWGAFINRRQAWRTDGGTAAFGVGAIVLAFFSTTLNFVYIPRQDQYMWMPKLMWAVTLWQSFLGWWWWVGAGMGVREVEELLHRENKRQQKRIARAQRRKHQREIARSVWKGVTGAFKPKPDQPDSDPSTTTPTPTVAAAAAAVASDLAPGLTQPVQLLQRWFANIRHAHLTAAHVQATERRERFHQVYQREEERNADWEHRKRVVGWGLGSFSIREAERERREELELEVRIPPPVDEDDGWKDEPSPSSSPSPDSQLRHRRPTHDSTEEEDVVGSSMWWWGPLRRWRLRDTTTYRS